MRVLGPHMIGLDPREPKAVNLVMDSVMAGHEYAKTPIDIACWDLLGKAAGLPISTLLGARSWRSSRYIVRCPRGRRRRWWKVRPSSGQGIRHFQMKVGGGADEDIARLERCSILRKREKLSWRMPTRGGRFTRLRGW